MPGLHPRRNTADGSKIRYLVLLYTSILQYNSTVFLYLVNVLYYWNSSCTIQVDFRGLLRRNFISNTNKERVGYRTTLVHS
jgi:hypothetical protein